MRRDQRLSISEEVIGRIAKRVRGQEYPGALGFNTLDLILADVDEYDRMRVDLDAKLNAFLDSIQAHEDVDAWMAELTLAQQIAQRLSSYLKNTIDIVNEDLDNLEGI